MPKMWTFRADLDRAGIPHEDERGRPVVFHSLRVTFCTWLARTVKEPRIAMELMRHTSMALTMTYYTDPRLLDTAKAIDALPDLDRPVEAKAALRNGTDDRPVESGALKCVPEGPEQSFSVPNGNSNVEKPLKNKGFQWGSWDSNPEPPP